MLYAKFREKVKNYPFFRSNIFRHLTDKPQLLRDQIVDWVKKGYVICLKRGIYTLNDDDRAIGVSRYFLANNLYSPSYISLETALSYYGFIPERVHTITSVTTKKTQHFNNTFGDFVYRHIKLSAFNDFVAIKDEHNNVVHIATPEKAIIDFLYFKTLEMKTLNKTIFTKSFRFQNLKDLNTAKLKEISRLYHNKRLESVIKIFIEQLGEQNA